jgi:hypothetical protein
MALVPDRVTADGRFFGRADTPERLEPGIGHALAIVDENHGDFVSRTAPSTNVGLCGAMILGIRKRFANEFERPDLVVSEFADQVLDVNERLDLLHRAAPTLPSIKAILRPCCRAVAPI